MPLVGDRCHFGTIGDEIAAFPMLNIPFCAEPHGFRNARRAFVRKYVHAIAVGLFSIAHATALPAQSIPIAPAHLPGNVAVQGNSIAIDGDVTASVLQRVRTTLDSSHNSIREISIRSMGGDLESLMELGTLIHGHRIALRIDRLCAAACAAFLPSASPSLIVPSGSLIVLAQLPTPRSIGVVGVTADGDLHAKALKAVVDRETAYFRQIGVNADDIYAVIDMIDDVRAKLTTAQPVGRLGLALDSQAIRSCLGVSDVRMSGLTPNDTVPLTHLARTPFAFLLSGNVYFEGKPVLKSSLGCAPVS